MATPRHPAAAVAAAWSTHVFTAFGAVIGLLALLAISDGFWRAALLLMAAAMAIDSADGSLARWTRVKEVIPGFDGGLLDNMVDYLNYAVIPAFFLVRAGLLPEGWGLIGGAAVVLASGYQFSRADAKTEDHFFTGFPSYWNIVVFYLLLLGLAPGTGLAIVLVLAALVFVPFRYVYPSRTRAFRPLTIAVAMVWGAICLVELFRYPTHSTTMLWISTLIVPYYVGVSLLAQRRVAAGTA